MYALEINKLINWMLPSAIRKVVLVHLLNGLLWPVRKLNEVFVLYVDRTRYNLKITGQVRSLEFHLNRVFSPLANNIYITDSVTGTKLFIFLESENQPLYLPKFISGTSSEFTVHLPNSLPPEEEAIRAFLNTYKLPTKNYELLYDIIVM